MTFVTAIIAVQIQIQSGTDRRGSILTAQMIAKCKSATLSSIAPFSLSVWSFLATKPSRASVAPHKIYSAAKKQECCGKTSSNTENNIRLIVIMLAVILFKYPNGKQKAEPDKRTAQNTHKRHVF